MTLLSDYLANATQLRWEWGKHDCALWVADYVLLKTGRDAASEFRGRYKTQRGCSLVLFRNGGLINAMSIGAMRAGFMKTDNPQYGDPGIVETMVARKGKIVRAPTAAICLDNKWAVFSPTGLLVAPAKHLVAWSI